MHWDYHTAMISGAVVDGVSAAFVFQAEDGIRDYKVTGVQTCALPIFHLEPVVVLAQVLDEGAVEHGGQAVVVAALDDVVLGLEREQLALRVGEPLREVHEPRTEERRVGKEGRSRWAPDQ